jgi:hypothetical protein
MNKTISGFTAVIAALFGLAAERMGAQVTIFDNSPVGSTIPQSVYSWGDEVTASPGTTERTITDFTTKVDSFLPGTFPCQIQFFNVGPGNTVGTSIGSPVVQNITLSGPGFPQLNDVHFSGLNITVPDTFIWAVTLQDQQNASITPRQGTSPATVGSTSDTFWYLGANSGFDTIVTGDSPTSATFSPLATITAVPEPDQTAVAVSLLAFAVALAFRIKRNSLNC